ncbi:sugar phosphate isomerase/epimerase family protein [Schumannella luteola]
MSRLGAFSTLGCPELSADGIVRLAHAYGGLAVELRSAAGTPLHEGMTPDQLADLARTLRGTRLLSVSTYVRIGDVAADDGEIVDQLLTGIDLARALGAPAIRVFAGGEGTKLPARRLRSALSSIGPDVEILLETHDSHSTGASVARVLDAVGDARCGAIWDVAHPWAVGEQPEHTIEALWPWLRYVQLKDEPSPTERTPVLLGEGGIPLERVLDLLDERGYSGVLSLEWERAWHPSIPPLDEALSAAERWLGSVVRA